jgi:hypothetical protein
MAGAKLEKTRWPGIYRRGTRWVYAWTDATGNARRGTADTREEASRLKAEEEQRAIRRDIERYWLPPLGRRPLADITTPALGRVIGDLAARDGDSYLADRTLRRLFAPMAALMATAVDEGFIPHNPARDVTLPSGRDALRRFDPDADEDTDDPSPGKARSLTGEQLGAFLLVTDDRWRLLFELLAATGLRISEAIALRWRDLRLDGDRAAVRVRRARVKGHYGPRAGTATAKCLSPSSSCALSASGAARPSGMRTTTSSSRLEPGRRCCPRTPAPPGAQANRRGGRRSVGRIPLVPAHVRVDADQRWSEHRAGVPLARAPLPQLHARRVRAPHG